MFSAKDWVKRCKTCKHAKFNREYSLVTCHKDGACKYEFKENGFLTIDYEKNSKRNIEKTGKVCPTCGVWYPYSQLVPKTVKGKIYYTYCRECRRKQKRKKVI